MTAGRRERKKAQTRRAILSAAANLFSQRGYDQSSIDDIAEAADVAKRTLYNNFESKEEIVLALRFQYFETLIEEACQKVAKGESPLAAIENFVVDSISWAYEHPELAKVIFRDGALFPPPTKFDLLAGETICGSGSGACSSPPSPPFVGRMLELVVHCQEERELRSDLDAEFLVHIIGFIIVYVNFQAFRDRNENAALELSKTCFQALLQGLKCHE